MIVAFWGPVHGQVRTTSNMIAIATMIALNYQKKVLVTHTHFHRSTLENAYSKLRYKGSVLDIGRGVNAIGRLIQAGIYDPENIRDNAESIIKDRLDMLEGPIDGDEKLLLEILPYIFESSKRYYDLTFIDVSSGIQNRVSRYVINHADLVVVNLNQNKAVLDSFFNKFDWTPELDDKPILYCFGAFERASKYSLKRIARTYRTQMDQLIIVPRNTRYMDAINDQHIIDFLIRIRFLKQKFLEFDEDTFFAESLRGAGKKILRKLGIFAPEEEDDVDD
jgi:hypothetical protein